MKLTPAQRAALIHLASHERSAPSAVGQAMLEGRETRRHRSAQGYGRIGGMMCARLIKRGLVQRAGLDGWPRYSITRAGREVLSAQKERA